MNNGQSMPPGWQGGPTWTRERGWGWGPIDRHQLPLQNQGGYRFGLSGGTHVDALGTQIYGDEAWSGPEG